MREISSIKELYAFVFGIKNVIEEAIQITIESFEEMKKLNAELSEISEEKERFFYVYYNAHYILRKVKYKRLWKRQKIP